jgi:hypothetical protein
MSALQGSLLDMLGLQGRGWRAWRELSLLSALLLELCWIAPWAHALLQSPDRASLWAVARTLALITLSTYAIVRGSAILDLGHSLRRFALVLPVLLGLPFALAAILFPGQSLGFGQLFGRFFGAMRSTVSLIPDEFLVAFALLYVWMRAIRWAASDGLPSEVRARFKWGFFALIAYVLAFVWPGQGGAFGPFLYAFFFFGWVSMASARLARAESHAAAAGHFFRPNWLLAVLGGLLLCSLLLALLGWGIQAQFALIQRAILSLWLLFWGLVVLLLSPVIIAISLVFEWILNRVNLENLAALEAFRDFLNNTDENVGDILERLGDDLQVPFLQRLSDWLNSLPFAQWLAVIRSVFFWVVLLLVLVAGLYYAGKRIGFWRALRRTRSREIASVQNDEWWRTMASAWRSRLDDLRRNLANLLDPQQGRRLLAAARIRRVYTFLMDLSEELGMPRPKAQTPLEFMPTLLKLFPLHPGEVETISAAYMRVRYGELAETPTDVVEVDRAWLQLKLESERIKKQRKKEAADARAARRGKQKDNSKDQTETG